MSDEVKPADLDEYHAHEALDRASLLANVVEDELLGHPFVQANREVRGLVITAVSALADAYQTIGRLHLCASPPPSDREAKLVEATKLLLSVMEVHEMRERGEYPISSEVALCLWRDAQSAARSALSLYEQHKEAQ